MKTQAIEIQDFPSGSCHPPQSQEFFNHQAKAPWQAPRWSIPNHANEELFKAPENSAKSLKHRAHQQTPSPAPRRPFQSRPKIQGHLAALQTGCRLLLTCEKIFGLRSTIQSEKMAATLQHIGVSEVILPPANGFIWLDLVLLKATIDHDARLPQSHTAGHIRRSKTPVIIHQRQGSIQARLSAHSTLHDISEQHDPSKPTAQLRFSLCRGMIKR